MVRRWADENRLALNPTKTELLWFSSPRGQHLIRRESVWADGVEIVPKTELRLLGVLIDETLSFSGHIANVSKLGFFHLRRLKTIRRYLPIPDTISLVRALVLSRIDYCNSVLLGLPTTRLNSLQSVINTAVRLIFGLKWNAHVSQPLKDQLHWLKIPERIVLKRCWLTFRALYDPHCPTYLRDLIQPAPSVQYRSQLRSRNRNPLLVPPPARTPALGDRSFRRGNPILWNTLPRVVTMETSPGAFLKNMKTHLFKVSFGC